MTYEDDEYIAEKCYAVSDSCDEISFICIDSISAELFRRRVGRMVRNNEIPNMEIETHIDKFRGEVQHEIHLIPDMSAEDIVDYIASDIGLE